MNEQFKYLDGSIVVLDENGVETVIPYRDNIEDILILQNEIKYLETSLVSDKDALEATKKRRLSNIKKCGCISLVGSALAIGAAFGLSSLVGLSHEEITNTIFGPVSEHLVATTAASTVFVGMVQWYSISERLSGPSKKTLSGIEESMKYEQEMLDVFKDELRYLEEHPSLRGKDNVKENVSYNVSYKFSLDYLRQAKNLRYYFGRYRKAFIKSYLEGTLICQLIKWEFSDDVIMDFIEFIDNYLDGQNKEVGKTKK